MKYFLDTEFIEGFPKPFLGVRRHFIDLISIGIVAEDGREYYALCKEFDIDKANAWVEKNVLEPIYEQERILDYNRYKYSSGYTGFPAGYTKKRMKKFLKYRGKTRNEIAREIESFINEVPALSDLRCGLWPNEEEVKIHDPNNMGNAQPIFYAYFADYDWVLFCSLFGTMMDLPDGFPMYCRDLKQELDNLISPVQMEKIGYEKALERIKKYHEYPSQTNEHNALADAWWNLKLYKFIKYNKLFTKRYLY